MKMNKILILLLCSSVATKAQPLKCNILSRTIHSDSLNFVLELKNITELPYCFVSSRTIDYHIINDVCFKIKDIDLQKDTNDLDLVTYEPNFVSEAGNTTVRIIVNPNTSIIFKISIPIKKSEMILKLKYIGFYDKQLNYLVKRLKQKKEVFVNSYIKLSCAKLELID
jgi:hypothetical protein